MRWMAIPALALALAACGDTLSEEEQAEEDAAMAEEVRALNDAPAPLEEVVPDIIGYPDMEANDLLGLACSYAPGTSMGVRVIARENDAFMKIDGEMVRFAADPGSREMPANSRTLYTGQEYVLRVAIEEKAEAEGSRYDEGTIWLYDRWERVVYTGTGNVNCGA